MKTFVSELVVGASVDSLFSVKYKRGIDLTKNGKYYFSFGIADKTGEIEVTYWGGANKVTVQAIHDSFEEGNVINVVGRVDSYQDRKKISVNEGLGSVSVATTFNLSDFLPESTRNIDDMFSELLTMVDAVANPGLKALLNAFFRDETFAEKFKHAPGAMYLHHAWIGGLLEHSLAVAKTANCAASNYEVDQDLLTAGALLHDIGKLKELEVSTNIKVGEEGMLLGHITLGCEMVRRKAEEMGLDPHILLKLSHMIISHHGKQEYGSSKSPMFVESILVYYADEMDAKASQFERIKRDTNSEDFRVYDKYWGEIYLK